MPDITISDILYCHLSAKSQVEFGGDIDAYLRACLGVKSVYSVPPNPEVVKITTKYQPHAQSPRARFKLLLHNIYQLNQERFELVDGLCLPPDTQKILISRSRDAISRSFESAQIYRMENNLYFYFLGLTREGYSDVAAELARRIGYESHLADKLAEYVLNGADLLFLDPESEAENQSKD